MLEWLTAAAIVLGLVALFAVCALCTAALPAPFNRHKRNRRR